MTRSLARSLLRSIGANPTGSQVSVVRLSSSENSVFCVEGPDIPVGKLILRVSGVGRRTVDDLLAEISFLSHLRKLHLPVAEPISTVHQFVHDGNLRYAVFFRHRGGIPLVPAELTTDRLIEIGGIMSRMHEAALDYESCGSAPSRPSWWDLDNYQVGPLQTYLAASDLSQITGLLRREMERCDESLTVHGDLGCGNILSSGSGLGVIDFDDCSRSVPAHDFAALLVDLLFDHRETAVETVQTLTSLCTGYTQSRGYGQAPAVRDIRRYVRIVLIERAISAVRYGMRVKGKSVATAASPSLCRALKWAVRSATRDHLPMALEVALDDQS